WRRQIIRESETQDQPLSPQRAIHLISPFIENDAVVALDTGDHTLWFNRIFQAKEQDIVMSGRWRTLGFALAAAIAARLTFMDRQVVAVAGDGGIMQTF